MNRHVHRPRSHLFTLQFWQEEVNQGQTEWRGKVHQVSSGHIRYFRDWQQLITFLEAMLPVPEPDTHSEQEQN